MILGTQIDMRALAAACVVGLVIGVGGFVIGIMTGYDRGERDREQWCDEHHQAPALVPLAQQRHDPADPWRLGRHAAPGPAPGPPWLEPDTAPLRAILPRLGAPLRAAGRTMASVLGPGPNGDAHRYRELSPGAAQLVMQHQAEAAELEIRALAEQAEARIGRVKDQVAADLGRRPRERMT